MVAYTMVTVSLELTAAYAYSILNFQGLSL